MKRLFIILLATSAMTAAIPVIAMAHPPAVVQDQDDDNSWNNGGATYVDFNQEYQHIWQAIQHGVSDGAYSRRQASSFYRAMQRIRAHADSDQRRGEFDPETTQAQLEQLHERMHNAHENGHDRQDSYNNRDNNGYYNRR